MSPPVTDKVEPADSDLVLTASLPEQAGVGAGGGVRVGVRSSAAGKGLLGQSRRCFGSVRLQHFISFRIKNVTGATLRVVVVVVLVVLTVALHDGSVI